MKVDFHQAPDGRRDVCIEQVALCFVHIAISRKESSSLEVVWCPKSPHFLICLLFNNMLIIFWSFKHICLYMQCLLCTLFNCNFQIIDVGILWCSFMLCSVWSLHAFPITRGVVSGCSVLVLQSKDMRLPDWWHGISKLTFRCKCEWYISTVYVRPAKSW